MRWTIGLLLSLLIAIAISSGPASQTSQAAGPCDAQATSLGDSTTKGVWDEINSRRQANGYPAYLWSNRLADAAAWEARDRAQRNTTSTSETDSLGRNARQRATDCGYRDDAAVVETAGRVLNNTIPYAIVSIWGGGDAIRMYWAIRTGAYPPDSRTYQAAALGRYRNADGWEYWVLNMGTQPDSQSPQPTSTPQPQPTSTQIPQATSTPVPTATPIPPPPNTVDRLCYVDEDIVPGDEFWLHCRN